jgi:16S rRNA methyltransferase RsmB/F
MSTCSPCLLVTNHEGQRFPLVRPSGHAKLAAHGTVRFDRILCDVPCSGDGTMRKAPDIWRRWTHKGGNGLHGLQLQILVQACKLLKVCIRTTLGRIIPCDVVVVLNDCASHRVHVQIASSSPLPLVFPWPIVFCVRRLCVRPLIFNA